MCQWINNEHCPYNSEKRKMLSGSGYKRKKRKEKRRKGRKEERISYETWENHRQNETPLFNLCAKRTHTNILNRISFWKIHKIYWKSPDKTKPKTSMMKRVRVEREKENTTKKWWAHSENMKFSWNEERNDFHLIIISRKRKYRLGWSAKKK